MILKRIFHPIILKCTSLQLIFFLPILLFFSPNSFELLRKEYQIILKNNFDKIFNSKITYQNQINIILHLLKDCSGKEIGRLFGISGSSIRTYRNRFLKGNNRKNGRPPILNKTHFEGLKIYITSAFHQAGFYLEENINIVRVNIKYARAVREINHIPSKNIINGKQTVEIPSFS